MPDLPRPPLPELDLSRLTTGSLADRPALAGREQSGRTLPAGGTFAQFLASLPDALAARDLLALADAVAAARRAGRPVLLGMGAHPLKVGLGPLLADALREGIITGLATNGAAAVHDFELALAGRTSEEVGGALGDGSFGMTRETAEGINRAVAEGNWEGLGAGEAVGRLLAGPGFPHQRDSVFAAAFTAGCPATIHTALGTDVVHMHPSCDGAAWGEASLRDFRLFTRQVAALEGGVYLNLGSAVILPEVFLKAVAVARNLGHPLAGMVTANLDFLQHYRPRVNVVTRPPAGSGGRGFALTGHHEIMLPLLLAAVRERLR